MSLPDREGITAILHAQTSHRASKQRPCEKHRTWYPTKQKDFFNQSQVVWAYQIISVTLRALSSGDSQLHYTSAPPRNKKQIHHEFRKVLWKQGGYAYS